MNKKALFIELHYLPCIQYMTLLNFYKNVIIDLKDNYTKQSYRNRCQINGANKMEDLIIPTKKKSESRLTQKTLIDNNQKWLNQHLRAIQTAYGKAPFFEYYMDDFKDIFNKKGNNLFSFSKALLTKCLEILDLEVNLDFADQIENFDENEVYDARDKIHPKKQNLCHPPFMPESYFQVFGNNFVPNLSVIDLIFCEGPLARDIIQKSCRLA